MRKPYRPMVLLALLLMLASCRKPTPAPTAAPTATPAATATPLPTATPTAAPPAMVLVASPEADTAALHAAQTWLQARAQEAGAQMVVQEADAALPPHTLAVLGVAQAPPAAEGARRLMIAAEGAETPEGVQVVRMETAGLPARAFLAGYLSVLITKDWRAGLLAAENEEAAAAAFEDGGRYFCGLCRPLYPPFLVYPQYVLLPAGSEAATWQAGAQRLLQASIHTLVLSPEALQGMGTPPEGVTLIALDTPPEEQTAAFAAVITTDWAAALDALWAQPDVPSIPAPIQITVLDTQAISPGRAALVEEVRERLQEGLIQP